MKPQLTIGPVQFHWNPEQWKNFYRGIAGAPVDIVYIGEVVCSKRAPFYEPLYGEIADMLQDAGTRVVFSTLAEVAVKLDRKVMAGMCAMEDFPVEANDASALHFLSGSPHRIGPFLNVYNEDSLDFLARNGATHICFPPELPRDALKILAGRAQLAGMECEVQVYGRIPLALSARCYHARAHGRVKDNCQFVCEKDPDGMNLKTVKGKSFLAINGIETMSHSCLNLVQELDELQKMGISHFRISPHSHDMGAIAQIFRDALDRKMNKADAVAALSDLRPDFPFSNGFYHRREGYQFVSGR